ncbi:hypothetical protein FHS95_001017 [Sphingomonas naasensis]|uniref:Uncharacterized protein n=1 Tax=Sphingomonas naasensis TaxID=1344951 RepID=A0A4S1WVS6_9SPHN|nr:hypothetical protein [Sphingomonas naasensis]NIJ19348.1 hypothetical protein [Sphingomonas naasensis]TGX46517.1 hypothetical protein E5A74_05075 [Sphingomonas naasensis]
MSDRYAGKPFLKLLESYVLDAIGHLDPAADAALRAMEPHYRTLFGATGSWREIVVGRMQFQDGMQGAIREVWQSGRVRFREANGREPDPMEFTRVFIDSKFPH